MMNNIRVIIFDNYPYNESFIENRNLFDYYHYILEISLSFRQEIIIFYKIYLFRKFVSYLYSENLKFETIILFRSVS